MPARKVSLPVLHKALLVINAGSATTKFSVFALGKKPEQLLKETLPAAHGIKKFLEEVLPEKLPDVKIKAVGHRLVHGGKMFTAPVRIDDTVLKTLETLAPMAPLHLPAEIENIKEAGTCLPDVPQFGCFDTSFHATQPEIATLFPLPWKYAEEGILRYGFHGLSYEYIASVLPEHAGEKAMGKIIVAHLGGGASLCAMEKGRSIATTMGFTGLDGLMMATRSGAIDPGLILYLLSEKRMNAEALARLLYKESGLLGVSGISGDIRELEKSSDEKAARAIDLFCYRAVQELGKMLASLQGLDVLVFTAGIGENNALVRKKICVQLGWLGVEIDREANRKNAACISTPSSAIGVYVIPTNEERMIAAHVSALFKK